MLLFQVHANILSAIVGVDWQWQSEVSDIMGLSTAPTGSVLEFDLGWLLAAVCQAELSCCVWVAGAHSAHRFGEKYSSRWHIHSSWLVSCSLLLSSLGGFQAHSKFAPHYGFLQLLGSILLGQL